MKKWFEEIADSAMSSALVKLAWLAIVAFVVWKFFRGVIGNAFWIGYGVAALVLLWLMTKVNPVAGDKVYSNDFDGDGQGGTINDYVQESVSNSPLRRILKF